MSRQYYSRRHYSSVSPARDTQAEIDWRLRRNAALALVDSEMRAKFPVITTENAASAFAYQRELLDLHLGRISP